MKTMYLVIVESPTKCRTLGRFLGKEYQLKPTMGHIRDLPKSKLGVEIEDDFKPSWALVSGKKEAVADLKKAVKKAKLIILATDPDREGEAIAWHTAALLKEDQKKEFSRIVFHEITKAAIERALKNPRRIDRNLVAAQKARRILDRLVGYKLSPLLWRKIRQGLSAGRVQSVAVRLIVEREREIEKFRSEAYWRLFSALSKDKAESFIAELVAKDGLKYESKKLIPLFSGEYTVTKTSLTSEAEILAIIKELTSPFLVFKLEKKERLSYPPPPFITSTLQQGAGQRFGFSGKMTMKIAQDLYERGLITYHRTDSTHLANSAILKIRQYIKSNFGGQYLPAKARVYKTQSKLAQEAHEAIRPTSVPRKQILKGRRLGRNHQRLYELIWQRTVACQMNPARLEKTNLQINCGDYQFVARGQRMLFQGFLKVYPLRVSENILPAVKEGDRLNLVSLAANNYTTTPPPAYTEASLVKALEKEGIGRPSTYAPTVSLIQGRQYVEKTEGKFHPTSLGEAVNDFLVKNFSDIVDIPFTAQMENSLDDIARGQKKWQKILKDFWQPFGKKLKAVLKNSKRVKVAVEKTGKKCPKCGHDLVVRIGRFGKFIACSHFPKCRHTEPYFEIFKGVQCPKCGGEVVIKKSRKDKQFYGCRNWPKCNWASWSKPTPPA